MGQINSNVERPDWKKPNVVKKSDKLARPDMKGGSMKATIYQDVDPELDKKITYLAGLIKKAKNVVIYSGAGISTAAGIGDVASDKKDRSGLNRL